MYNYISKYKMGNYLPRKLTQEEQARLEEGKPVIL